MLEMTLYIVIVLILAVVEAFWSLQETKRCIKKIFQKIREKEESKGGDHDV